MTRFLSLCTALFLAFSSGAEARGAIQFGLHETMIHIADTHEVGPEGPLALCQLTHMRTAMFMGYWLEVRGMVLAPNNCAAESYYDLPAGLSAPDLATTEIVQFNQERALHYARGYFWLYAVPVFLFISTLLGRRKKAKADIRREALALEPGPVFQFIDAMCHAAVIDGAADPAEIAYITDVARDLTGLDYRAEHFEYAAFHCDKLRSVSQFRQFGQGLDHSQKQMIMRGVISVLWADGHLERPEKIFLKNLSKALGLRRRDVRALMPAQSTLPAAASLA